VSFRLSVLLPIYNEERELAECLTRVLASPAAFEVIAVDDCSSDSTPQILGEYRDQRLRVIRHENNCGKGGAIQTALAYANGDVVIIQDADTEYDPCDYDILLAALAEAKNRKSSGPTVAYGVRDTSKQPVMGHLGNHFLTWATNLLCRTALQDMETCYKLVPTGLMRELHLNSRGFEIEPEITVKLARRGAKFVQVPISYKPRKDKKLRRVRDGYKSLMAIFRYRFAAM
jgi:glycosyltransferase involved in cell wall biosynthesis